MIFQWIVLFLVLSFIAFSYYKQYSLMTRLIWLMTIAITSLILVLPIFKFSISTLLGLFLIERIWIILAAVLFIEVLIDKRNRLLRGISAVVSIIIYFYLRTVI
ncbi:hypothetical protein Desmer_2447 [Desulfosporosinus meridiei DSM 13257]|uniref:Uncharacterized protein n=1 Tax=Desulfosporosinus meridiei (strain ATCC BAA-275 / DSM 13257 / KCTC 12902 / NCIMB 13706 / S10) TaxID=768704 RepID=J7J096_DESMD|nr:hypothetical protein Desmer_2447 [Desulfosporosinus meridiei DSM 13257]